MLVLDACHRLDLIIRESNSKKTFKKNFVNSCVNYLNRPTNITQFQAKYLFITQEY